MDSILSLLARYKYAAMFTILVLCGMGLPLPEELTLLSSGLAVGWKEADFFVASAACVAGILAGDSVVFGLGRYFGRRLLASRPMRFFLSPRRQVKVQRMFGKHGNKAVFFARFFAGLRVGVYAYAGQHGMSWFRFILLDFLGAMISGPTSIWIGKFAAEKIAEPHEAREFAERLLRQGQHWLYVGIGVLALSLLAHWLWSRRVDRRIREQAALQGAAPRPPVAQGPSEAEGRTRDCP